MADSGISSMEKDWLEWKLRRRFYGHGLGIWVETGGWDSTYVTVSVRKYRGGVMQIFVVSCVGWDGEIDVRKTFRLLRGKIKEWVRSL